MHEPESSNQLEVTQEAPYELELKTWVAEASCGNRTYQKRLYEHLSPRVYRVIRRIVGTSDADDVMQEFVIQFFAKLNQFRFESSLETWAHRMAVNQSLQHLRKSSRDAQRLRNLAVKTQMNPVTNKSENDDDAEMLRAAMENISGEQRAILHMKEVEGLGYQAIAHVLGIPEGTVGSRLNKARKELRASLIGLGWEA